MFARAALTARNGLKARPLTRKMGYVTDFKPQTMSDLPTPSGSWSEAHSKKQTKNNVQLLVGVAFAAFTLAFAKQSGLVEFGLRPKIGNI